MKAKFKALTWNPTIETSGLYAEPSGLEYKYQISHDNSLVQFAILDANHEFMPGYPEYCQSTSHAQEKANQHYQSVLKRFIIV